MGLRVRCMSLAFLVPSSLHALLLSSRAPPTQPPACIDRKRSRSAIFTDPDSVAAFWLREVFPFTTARLLPHLDPTTVIGMYNTADSRDDLLKGPSPLLPRPPLQRLSALTMS